MNQVGKIIIAGVCLVLGVIAGIGALMWSSQRTQLKRVSNESSAWEIRFTKVSPRIARDMELLIEQPFFTDFARLQDASPLLLGHRAELEAAQTLYSRLTTNVSFDLAAAVQNPDLSAASLDWVDELSVYTHVGSSALKIDLLPAATLRFAQLVKAEDYLEAANLFRHLTYLTWTKNNLSSAKVVVAMLNQEKKFADFLTEKRKLPDYPLALIDQNRIDALWRSTNAWAEIYRAPSVAQKFKDLKRYFAPDTGACSASSELASRLGLAAESLKVRSKILIACGVETNQDSSHALNSSGAGLKLYEDLLERERMPAAHLERSAGD